MAGRWTGRGGTALPLGSVAGIPVRVDVSWFLVAAVLAAVVAPVVEARVPGISAVSSYVVGLAFAILLYTSVFLHELAHALTGQWLGLRVRSITITLLGGLSEFVDDDPRPGRDALVAAAGPAASIVIAGAAWYAARPLEVGLVRFLVLQLAVASMVVAGFNLLPTLPLDGGHLLKDAIWAVTGRPGLGYVVAGRAGYLLAVVLVVAPWVLSWPSPPALFSALWSAALAWFVVGGARAAVSYGRFRERLPRVSAAGLVRPVEAVRPDVSLADGVDRLERSGAAGLVVVDAESRPVAIVDGAAASAVPIERRPYIDVRTVSRPLPPDAAVPASLEGLSLLRRLQETPAPAHVIVDADGRVRGILLARDVEALLAA